MATATSAHRLLTALAAQLDAPSPLAPADVAWREAQLRLALARARHLARSEEERKWLSELERRAGKLSSNAAGPSSRRLPLRSTSSASFALPGAAARSYLVAGLSDSDSESSLSDSDAGEPSPTLASIVTHHASGFASPEVMSPTLLSPTSFGHSSFGHSSFGHEQHGIKRKPSITLTDMDQAPGQERLLHEDASEQEDEMDAYDRAAKATAEARGDASSSQLTAEKQEPTAAESDRATHDSLSSELLRMAGVLKANSYAFADALERDRKLVEATGEKLQGNLDLMTRTRGRLAVYAKQARGMGWATLGAVAVVCMSWVLMFILIKLT